MAAYEKMSEYTYRLTVCQGYDSKGKKIRKRKTIKLKKGLSQKQIDKELNRQMVLFEREVTLGNFLEGEKITFEEFTERWFKDYAEVNLTPATIASYKQKLESRIIPAIGHIKLAKLQPMHIMELYHNLKENNIRLNGKFKSTKSLIKRLENLSASIIEKETGITFKTCQRFKKGLDTDFKTAKKLCDFYRLDINKMFTHKNEKPLTEKTIRNHIGIISIILSTALKWNIVQNNPVLRIDLKKIQKPKVKYYDDEQIKIMLKALNNEPLMYQAMVYLAIDTGLRKSELNGLTWADVDFDASTISINKQRHYVMGYGTFVDNPKTQAGVRIVTISKTVLNLLKNYKKEQNKNRLKLGSAWNNCPYVFIHEDGSPIGSNRPYNWFIKFLNRHNLPKITFHQLRHTNASLLIASGEDIVTVSGRLGHADKNITLNTYSHIIKSKEAQVADRMDGFYARLKISNL